MSRFGWAYVSSAITGSVANGPTNSVQFNSGSQVLSGSSNFTFNPATNTLVVTGTISASVYQGITVTSTPAGSDKQIQYNSGSTLGASSNLTFDYTTNTLFLTGTLRADNLIVSSSQILKSGSTIFGDDLSDTHQFTGSILGGIVSGTIARFITITGSTALITNITGNLFGTASFATLAATASYYNTSSLLITASVSGAVLTFTKGDGTTFNTTVDNVTNAQTASYVLNSVSSSFATNAATASLLSGFDKNDYVLTSSFNNFTSSYNTGSFSGSFTGSLLGTSSYATLAATASYYNTSSLLVTASISDATLTFTKGDGSTFPVTVNNVTNAQTASYASNADLLDNRDSTTFAGTGSNTFNGNQIITGTLNVSSTLSGTTAQFTTITGSTITGSTGLVGVVTSSAFSGGSFVGTTISGTTAQFTTITGSTITGSTGLFTTITASEGFVSGGLSVGNYVQMLPVGNVTIPTNQTASYIYTSGSTNDLYFTQYQPGTNFTNTTRLRWLESTLSTGLLHGGILSTVNGTTTFNLTSGSGLILTYNATTGSDPYPTIQYVNWPSYVSQSLFYITSSQISYISLDQDGEILQSPTAPTFAQFKDRIVIGRILHQSSSITNGAINTPPIAYALATSTADFIRAIGPLKINGHFLAASGSTLGLTKTSGDSYVEGRNYAANPNIPNVIVAADDPDVTISKIYRQRISGSQLVIDTGVGGAGYTTVDPTLYQDANGNLQTVGGSNFTVQRVFWFPKAVNRALFVYYGQERYTNLDDAIAGITTENFTEGDNTKGSAILVGFLVMRGNVTDFDTPNAARIYQASTFRGGGAGGGGGTTGGTTLPAGSSSYVQFNDVGSFGADSRFTFNKTTHTLTVTGTGSFSELATGLLTASAATLTSVSGTTAQFTTITGSIVTGSTALFTTLTASAISANSIPAFGANQTIQYNNAGVLNGSTNLTFDGTQIRLTGSMQVVSGTTIVTEILASGVRTTGKPVQVRNVSSIIVGVIDENGTVSGSIGRFGTVTGSVLTSSNEILIANNATIGGNIFGSGAIKGAYATYTGSFTIPSNSYFVGISSTGSVITASLSSATNYPAGQTLYLKDIGGNAETNNIRIKPSGSQTIDGATSLVISITSGSATLISNGVDGFYIVGLT